MVKKGNIPMLSFRNHQQVYCLKHVPHPSPATQKTTVLCCGLPFIPLSTQKSPSVGRALLNPMCFMKLSPPRCSFPEHSKPLSVLLPSSIWNFCLSSYQILSYPSQLWMNLPPTLNPHSMDGANSALFILSPCPLLKEWNPEDKCLWNCS